MALVPKNKNQLRQKHSKHRAFYDSPWWRSGPPRQLLKDNPICVWFGKRKQCQKKATIVDHIHAITDGGNPYDLNEMQVMCKSCSAYKTKLEAEKRMKKSDKTITPLGLV